MISLQQIARPLGGEVVGASVLCPGPGLSAKDRSLSVTPSAGAPDGFLVHSYAGDDWQACRDHVRPKVGLAREPGSGLRRAHSPRGGGGSDIREEASRIASASLIWEQSGLIAGTLAARYLRSHRELTLGDEDLSHAIRFHSRCPWGDGDTTLYVPAMIAAMRQIDGDALMAVQRTRLGPDGAKIERRMLGKASGAAIKIDPDGDVTYGLTIGEGLETCLAARQLGFRACWALGAAGAIRTFPVLAVVDCLTLLAETDDSGANARAIATCGDWWLAEGREVIYATPGFKGDMNDVAIRCARR